MLIMARHWHEIPLHGVILFDEYPDLTDTTLFLFCKDKKNSWKLNTNNCDLSYYLTFINNNIRLSFLF